MDRDKIVEIIRDFHEMKIPEIVPRELKISKLKTRKAIAIIGPRRAGKTYYMFHQIKELLEKGVRIEDTLYINFEDDRLYPIKLEEMDTILKIYYEMYPEAKKRKKYFFFDEIQNVPNWEKFVRRILDTENAEVYLSGSSSKLLGKEIATSLRGRAISYTLLPFSFREYLSAKKITYTKYQSSYEKARILHELENYLKFGGFPEIVLEEDVEIRNKILKSYIDSLLLRDIVERYSIKNIKILRLLFNSLLSSFSKEFSIHKFYNFLKSQGYRISKNSLYEYVSHFEDSLTFFFVKKFAYSVREIEQSLPKVYPVDTGYVYQYDYHISENIGRLMENIVCVELFRKYDYGHIYYWKNSKYEVDFVIVDKNRVKMIIQVCYNIDDENTLKREIRSLLGAYSSIRPENMLMITWDVEDKIVVENREIKVIPLYKFLLFN